MASEVYFSTNPADWTRLEGLYVSERKPPGFIRGRDLSVVGLAGLCVRGPLTPQEITSPTRFLELYGGRDYGSGGALVGQVWAALLNKKFGKLVVRRVAAAAAALATVNLVASATPIVRVDAANPGTWANGAAGGITVSVEAASDADATHFNLRYKYLGKEYVLANLNTQTGNDNLATTLGDDAANLIVLTKLSDGRPTNVANQNLAGGTNGTINDTDYTAGITDLANFPGIAICLVPESAPTQATLNGTIVTLANTVKDRVFLTWSGTVGQSVSANKTALTTQITTRSDRIVWCYNAPKTLDPETGLKIDQAPHIWMASIMSQTDVDVHKGSHETMELLSGVAAVNNDTLTRQDLIDLRDAGISTLEHLADEGFLFRSAVTTDLTPGKTEIARRLMTDFLQLSASDRLKAYVKQKNSRITRAQQQGELIAFSRQLQSQGRIIDEDNTDAGPGFIVDSVSVNTAAQRAQGLEKLLWRVRLIGHQLYLVLETEIGTGVVIEA